MGVVFLESGFVFLYRLLEVVEAVAIDFPIPENETSNTIELEAFTITVNEIDLESFTGFEFIPMTANVPQVDMLMATPTISLSIPASFLNDVQLPPSFKNESKAPRISNTVYQTDVLFSRRNNNSQFVVGSIITSATLSLGSTIVRVNKLDPPIVLTFAKREDIINGTNVSCNFWSFSADGELVQSDNPGELRYHFFFTACTQMALETGPQRTVL